MVKAINTMRKVLTTLQGYQQSAFFTDVLMQVETRVFDDGDYGILVTLNFGDEWKNFNLYSYELNNTAKNRAKLLSDVRKYLKAKGVQL